MVNSVSITGTATVAASAAAGSLVYASLTNDPSVTAVVKLQVPSNQVWLLDDLYILTAGAAGTSVPRVRVYKNDTSIMADTPPLSALLVSNNSRPKPFGMKALGYEAVSTMSHLLTTTTANDATADSIVYYTTGTVLTKQ